MRAVNLIPAEQRDRGVVGAGRSGGAAYAVIIAVAGLALLAFLYGRADRQISSSRAQVATAVAQTQRAQAQAQQLAPYTSFAAMRERRMKTITDLVDSRFDWAHAIHEFGRVLPGQVSVSSLTGTIGTGSGSTAASGSSTAPSASSSSAASTGSASGAAGAGAVTSATPAGTVPLFTLTGCATSQPAVALMLDRLRLIDGVSSVTLQSSTKSKTSAGTGQTIGACTSSQPAYTVQIAFEPLPSSAVTNSVTRAASSPENSRGGSR
jgi:Tfp pilus assembly protein PilN